MAKVLAAGAFFSAAIGAPDQFVLPDADATIAILRMRAARFPDSAPAACT